MTKRDKDEFLFECDEHGHSHDETHERDLALTTTYLAEHQVFEVNLITGVLHFSEEFMSQLRRKKNEHSSPYPIAALHITTMNEEKNIMMIDESQAIEIVTLLLEWVTRLNKEGEG